MEKSFFKKALEVLENGQTLDLRITRKDDKLTVLATGKTKLFTANGLPEEFENKFFPTLQKGVEEKNFSFTFTEIKGDKEIEEEEAETADDVKTETPAKPTAKKKAEKAVKAKKDTKKEEVQETEEVKSEEIKEESKKEIAAESNKTRLFNSLMSEAAQLFAARKYSEAQDKYQEALKIFPEDKTAIAEEAKAAKWVKAIADL